MRYGEIPDNLQHKIEFAFATTLFGTLSGGQSYPENNENNVNFFDTNSTSSYQVIMGDPVFGPRPPVLQAVPSRYTAEGNQVSFIVQASDPDGTTPSLTATPLPVGANFIDQGNGTGVFDWTPVTGQMRQYTIAFKASDGQLSDTKLSTITVNPSGDTDGDGMDDAWEIQHFGNLSRDGLGDFDGDGISDYQEYLDGTDPTIGDGPGEPVIQSPLYGTEVTSVQPSLTIVNSSHAANKILTYEFEVYMDASMTTLVASTTGVAEGIQVTAWQVTPALQDNTWYTWRIRAFDGTLYSLWVNGQFFVNTVNDVPGAFNINSPQDNTEVNTFNPVLEVTNSVDVDEDIVLYSFEVFSDSGLINLVASVADISAGGNGVTNWLVDTALLENAYYYWRVTAIDEHGAQTFSSIASFFVNTANDAPGLPAISAPADGSIVNTNTLDLIIDNTVDPDGDNLFYYFELDTANSFDSQNKQLSGPIAEGIDTTQWNTAGLSEDVTYYWRVRASDGLANSGWVQASFTVNATNLPPNIPTVNNPGNGAWVAMLLPTLSVNPAADPDGDDVSYHFELYSDASLTTLISQYSTQDLSWMLTTPLSDNVWYYWRVRAEDIYGLLSDWSTVSGFFVDDNGVDDVPVFEFIEPATDIVISTGTVDVRWNDVDPDSNATIELYYDTDNGGTDGVLIDSLTEDPDGAGDMFTWRVTKVPNGTYWIYAIVSDATSTITVYTLASVTIETTELYFDNRDSTVTEYGEWTGSTVVSGFYASDYQYHAPNGPSPDALVVDNSDADFSTLGEWPHSTDIAGYNGEDYQYHDANGDPVGGFIIDNQDPAFSTLGDWPSSTSVSGYYNADYQTHESNGDPPGGIIIDNSDSVNTSTIGAWPTSTSTGGYYADNYQVHVKGSGANTFSWITNVTESGSYNVYARWTSHNNRASNAKYTVDDDTGSTVTTINQRTNGGQWNLLGTFTYTQGMQYNITLSDNANGYVIADAVKLVPVNASPNSAIWTIDVTESGGYYIYARWTQHANRATNATYAVNDDSGTTPVTVNQQQDGGQWNLLGTFSYTAGVPHNVTLTDQADGYVIADALKIVPVNTAPNSAIWIFNIAETGQHNVYARWTAHSNRATNATYAIESDSGSDNISVNQQQNGGQWYLLGTFNYTQGSQYSVTLTDQADGYVIADAVAIVPVDAQPNRFIWNIDVPETGNYNVYGRWTAHPNRATNAKYLIDDHSGSTPVVVNQRQNGAKWNLLGTLSFTLGTQYSVTITDEADGYVIADAIKLVPAP